MTPTRSVLIAMAAVALLIGARPIASVEQYPHGLMAAAPTPQTGNSSCTIETRSLSFGNYDTLAGTDLTAIGQVIYTCEGVGGGGGGNPGGPGGGNPGGPGGPGGGNPGGPGGGNPGGPGTTSGGGQAGIRIEMAQGTSNSFASRGMIGPEYIVSGRFLDYNIYLDAQHHQVWGTGEGPTLAYVDAHPPNRTPVQVPAYGRIFGRQDVMAGPYSDTVPVRILF